MIFFFPIIGNFESNSAVDVIDLAIIRVPLYVWSTGTLSLLVACDLQKHFQLVVYWDIYTTGCSLVLLYDLIYYTVEYYKKIKLVNNYCSTTASLYLRREQLIAI